MRTTVDIENKLLASAKATALDQGKTLSAVVNDALREFSFGKSKPAAEPWVPATFDDGGLLPGVDIDSNAALEETLADHSALNS